jgi:hypothetical protein
MAWLMVPLVVWAHAQGPSGCHWLCPVGMDSSYLSQWAHTLADAQKVAGQLGGDPSRAQHCSCQIWSS